MTLEFLVQLATLVSIAAGVVGIALGVRIYRRQANAQMFLEYTRRYHELMATLPGDARSARLQSAGDPPEESDELRLVILGYLNLCSEEFYLWRTGYLANDVWCIWEDEMSRTLRSPLLRREWTELRQEFESYPDFTSFVDRAQN